MKRNDTEVQRVQLEGMSTEQLLTRVKQTWSEMNMFLDELFVRDSVQDYTEQQYNELFALSQEILRFLEALSPFPLEWVGKRNELIGKLKQKVGKEER